ncbi:Phage protein Gp37/Gp68 [compost metagenome]
MHPEWLDDIMNACTLRRYPRKPVPFLFKQWGEWVPVDVARKLPGIKSIRSYALRELPRDDNAFSVTNLGTVQMVRVGKKLAGREIYGTEYLQFPKALAA